MRFGVETAAANATVGARVATPLALVLLKLEAGGPQDRNSWRACWARVEPDLARR